MTKFRIGAGALEFRLYRDGARLMVEHVKLGRSFAVSETQFVAWLRKRAQESFFGCGHE